MRRPEQPDDYQARFNCDGSLWMWEYERNKSAADFNRLIRRIQDGHISVPLTPITLCYGAMPAEGVLRSMYYAGRMQRRYGLQLPTVQPMEDQTMPYGVGSLFAGAGAKYGWMGICSCASRVPDNGAPRTHEIYWWTGLDGRRLLLKWNSLHGNASLGGYAEASDPAGIVEYLDHDPGYLARWKYPLVKAAFGKGHDNVKTLTAEFESVARNKTTASRRVRNSNEIDFFQDFEATYGAKLPSYSAAFGNEWDLYPASLAEVSARVKRAIEKLRAAEALAVLVSLQNPKFMAGREAARDQAMMNMGLYFNHDWTGDGRISRDTLRDWAKGLAAQIEGYVGTLGGDASAALGQMIPTRGEHPRFYVFNPLGEARTDAADLPYTAAGPIHAIDLATGQETPSQRITIDGQPYLRVLAADVPSVGYKVFEIRPGPGQPFPEAATVRDNELENSVYRITVDGRGAITSLIDKTRGNRQFVRTVHGRAINDLGAGAGSLEVESTGSRFRNAQSHLVRRPVPYDADHLAQGFPPDRHPQRDHPELPLHRRPSAALGLQLRSPVARRVARGGRGGHPRQAAGRRRSLLAEPRPLRLANAQSLCRHQWRGGWRHAGQRRLPVYEGGRQHRDRAGHRQPADQRARRRPDRRREPGNSASGWRQPFRAAVRPANARGL